MRDLLLVMNPRRIEECIAAFRALPIDKLWIRGHTEYEIAQAWPDILALAAGYDRLLIASDDGIVRRHALAEVIRLLDQGHPVVTGYSNLSRYDTRVNLSKSTQKPVPTPDAYDLYELWEVMEYPRATVPTYLAGMCITGMSRELWERFPFRTFHPEPPGQASDFCLSNDLNAAGVPIVAAREAFVWHVKEQTGRGDRDATKRLYVGYPTLELECV